MIHIIVKIKSWMLKKLLRVYKTIIWYLIKFTPML